MSDTELKITPLTGRIGAQIQDIHLSSTLNPRQINQVYQALLKYKVIFFRGQHHLTDEEQEKFAALFGTPVKHPTVPVAQDSNYIFELDSKYGGRADVWHTDVTFIDAYPKLSILRAIKIPAVGGDTTWANTASAYQELPQSLKLLADHLRAIHTNDFDYGGFRPNADQSVVERHEKLFASTRYETEHPVVRIHPETGEKTLVLGQFFKRFVGLTTRESAKIFEVFQERITKPENTVRWKWQEGDVIIWDNRATQHLAVDDYGDAHRIVRRVTLSGEVPVGTDGQKSITLLPKNLHDQELEQFKTQAILNA
ncbi:TauD/TfdA family dioxygenase [Acinetobacter qingfengensis]|uniref:Taurine dioxygenase n=1 Tax=Acinetobacter qingfengensis TaxID=1262585 RepID=A0A1E7R3M8_9GAMM|nr:TauD/TfdA family dioxygenase [Acinetobacter qingfengensis]KAA8735389.1 TauD/TfdA family dioxygenase [Acinetobacter qingfengensis]OEY93902.1 taurine dioxygenase [Acinetobacter qingfengensis]